MQLHYRTKEDTTPNGKRNVFIHACGSDAQLRDEVCQTLLSGEHGLRLCVWHTDDPTSVFSGSGDEQLAEMSVFIPLVTDAYLRLLGESSTPNPAELFEKLQLEGIAVLPLLKSAELLPRFNRLFGELHGIALSLPDADRMVDDQLRRLLSDDELDERITREAFTGKLFLSYRKKDIKEAKEVMRAIHDTDAAGSASIWFDEFLVAGRNFNEDILQALTTCDAMALAVTPNILEDDNYVMAREYPEAVSRDITVLPVEAVQTDAEELADAYPGIGPCTNVIDRAALEELLRKAGFEGHGSRSAFAEYLLGMAFFIPVGVEKDAKRAIELFKTSARHGCAEACEQLGKLYVSGVGVRRDVDEGIRYYLQANEILMGQSLTEENLRHINRLYYDFDALPFLLKENGRVREAKEIQQAFFDRICNSPYGYKDEFLLYRVNALTDLSNLFHEYDLNDGRARRTADASDDGTDTGIFYSVNPGAGPSEGVLNRAQQLAEAALYTLDQYHGDDTDMAEFLRVVIYDQFADISKYRGDLEEAILAKQQSLELIEPLAERTGDLEHMDRSFQISNNLGLFYRELASKAKDPKLKEQAVRHLDVAVDKARKLVRLSPEFKGKLVHALSNRALVEEDPGRRTGYVVDAYDALLSLLVDYDIGADDAWTLRRIGGEFDTDVRNIKLFSRRGDRKAVFEKHYGEVPASSAADVLEPLLGFLKSSLPLVAIICAVLQFTGLVDVNGLMVAVLGEKGSWVIAFILVALYGYAVLRE